MNNSENTKKENEIKLKKLAKIKEVTTFLKSVNSKYWLNKMSKNKTLSGKYDVAIKVDMTKEKIREDYL